MKISVIIPHYRGKAYLKDALESLKLQEYPDIEVLLIKDGCDEDLEDLLEGRCDSTERCGSVR